MSPVIMSTLGVIGYSLKLSPVPPTHAQKQIALKPYLKQPLFQFRYDVRKGLFVREISEGDDGKDPRFKYDWIFGNTLRSSA